MAASVCWGAMRILIVALRKVTVTVYETWYGFAVTIDGDSSYLLQEYRTFR
jgi:hypothetical protein